MPEYTYEILVRDSVSQESSLILAYTKRELDLVITRIPDHIIITSVQIMGITISATDYLQQLTDEGNLNFGNY